MFTVGIDIGATKINFVALRNGRVTQTRKILTPKVKKEIIGAIEDGVRGLLRKIGGSISGIGIGVPGPLNEKGDLILNPPNLTSLSYTPLAKIIGKRLKIKTIIGNDANCFALAEAILGVGKNAKIVFGITLGSGVGGGLIIKSKTKDEKLKAEIYRGAFGSAGEVGHMTIKFDGPKCNCGRFGCLEEYCSERFFKKNGILPVEAGRLAGKGNQKMLKVFKEYGKNLGTGIANVVNLFDPEIVVVGGGISKASKFFLAETKKELKRSTISPLTKKYVKIKKAKLGELAGAMGAALLIHET